MDYENKLLEALDSDETDYEVVRWIERTFPELAESEDERIRKALLDFYGKQCDMSDVNGVYAYEVCAWLEKQKEQKPNVEICPHSIKSKSYKENGYPIEDCDYGLEIAYDILKKTFGEVRGYQTDDGIREHQTAIKAVRKAKEQKPTEKQDYSDFNDTERAILRGFLAAGVDNVPVGIIKETAQECLAQMPPAEWSEEDELKMNALLEYLDPDAGGLKYSSYAQLTEWYNWLKSLRPPQDRCKDCPHRGDMFLLTQGFKSGKHDLAIKFMNYLDENRPEDKMGLSNSECEDIDKAFEENDWATIMKYVEKYRPSWKPSEEQMEALERTIRLANFGAEENRRKALESLYKQLKKF